MTRFIPLLHRRVAAVLQLASYPLLFLGLTLTGLNPNTATLLALAGVVAVSVYLYYNTDLWQFGNAPDTQLDERQVQARNQAYRLAYMSVSALVVLLLLYLAIAADFGWPVLSGYDQLHPFFWTVWILVMSFPSAILAWTEVEV